MGFGWQELLIILLIAAVVFGTKKLRNIGGDEQTSDSVTSAEKRNNIE